MSSSPVILFTFNRPGHTRATLTALANNELADATDLIIYSDGASTPAASAVVEEVRSICRKATGFRSVRVVERPSNFGLAINIINGVTEVLSQYETVIVLEDDMVTSPYFLRYMNDGLKVYEEAEHVASIHAYLGPIEASMPETFFLRGADCWGWATWRRAWKHFEPDGTKLLNELEARGLTTAFDLHNAYPYTQMLRDQIAGKNRSWAIRWHASAFVKNMYTLHPGRTLVINTGGDGSGTHSGFQEGINGLLSATPVDVTSMPIQEDETAVREFSKFYRKVAHPGWRLRTRNMLKKIRNKFTSK